MNRGELVTAVRTRGSFTTDDGILTDAIIQALVNEALRAISIERDWDWQETSETISTVAGTDAYTPAATWGKTIGLKHTDEPYRFMRQVGLEESDAFLYANSGRGRPSVYTVYGGQLLIRPIPDAVYLLKHYFMKYETDLGSDGTSPLMPVQFHDAIVHLATSLAWARKGNDPKAREEADRYRAFSTRMADDQRRTTRPKKVRPREGYWS